MQKWEYQTLLVRQGGDKILEVIQINGKEAKSEVSGGLISKTRTYQYDLSSYLGMIGREGWEVTGVSPTTTYGGSNASVEGAVNVVVF